jgi:hypothetical protein
MKTSKQRQRERQKFLFRKHFFSKHRAKFMKDQKCEVTGELNCVNAHMKSRGAGGGYRDIVPLSWACHTDFDTMSNEKFEKKYGRTKASVRKMASYYSDLWDAEVKRRRLKKIPWR